MSDKKQRRYVTSAYPQPDKGEVLSTVTTVDSTGHISMKARISRMLIAGEKYMVAQASEYAVAPSLETNYDIDSIPIIPTSRKGFDLIDADEIMTDMQSRNVDNQIKTQEREREKEEAPSEPSSTPEKETKDQSP